MSSSHLAENYQLKWHSHLTNLNSSVATLYRNDKFADVLLLTSHPDGGCGIPAHKIILSSCSHFFASIFDSNPTPPNSMVYIVLPPELTKRSIQILIQYMYSGEATVSNDILNEVLHGGELLRIRGLWRNKSPSNENSSNASHTQYMPSAADSKSTKLDNDGCVYGDKSLSYDHPIHERNTNNLSIIKESPVIVTSPTSHKSLPLAQHSHMHTQSNIEVQAPSSSLHHLHHSSSSHSKSSSHVEQLHRSSCVSTENTVIPQEFQCARNNVHHHHHQPPPPPPLPPPSSSSSASLQSQPIPLTHDLQHNTPNIIVKKELAMNVNDEMVVASNIPASHYGLVSLQIAAAAQKKAQQSDKRTSKMINENGNAQYQQQIARRYSEDNYMYVREGGNDMPSGSQHHHHLYQQHREPRETDLSNRRSMNHMKQPQQRPNAQHSIETMVESNTPTRKLSLHEHVPAPPPPPNQPSEAMRMPTIKQEPLEWSDFEHENALVDKSNLEVNVKPEMVDAKDDSDGDESEMQDQIYSPLTCELCSETFTIPADWVRHIESHTEPVTHCVPKKRKRIEENLTENTAALRCDLCSMYFVTPAEWVRHVQNMHTETELALSNNNQTLQPPPSSHRSPSKHLDGSSTTTSSNAQNMSSEKSCVVCKKMFPSYASMVIHKRTHTDKYQ